MGHYYFSILSIPTPTLGSRGSRLEHDTDRIEMLEHEPKKIANIKLDASIDPYDKTRDLDKSILIKLDTTILQGVQKKLPTFGNTKL